MPFSANLTHGHLSPTKQVERLRNGYLLSAVLLAFVSAASIATANGFEGLAYGMTCMLVAAAHFRSAWVFDREADLEKVRELMEG